MDLFYHLYKLTIVWICSLQDVLAKPLPQQKNSEQPGRLVFGDVFTKESGLPSVSVFNAVTDPDKLWSNNIVYYDYASNYDSQQVDAINVAITDLVNAMKVNGETCVDIVKIDSNDPNAPENYVYIEKRSGCTSYVGMIGGQQPMSLDDACVNIHGIIQHEFIHAMGFYHEHQRSDRDDYVEINWDNIEDENLELFYKTANGDLLGQGYDYGSVMHYDSRAYAKNPDIPTIVVLDSDAQIGQRVNVSTQDAIDIQFLYGCTPQNARTRTDLFKPTTWTK